MYLYTLNKNNELYGTFSIKVDCEEGFYNYKSYKCWASPKKLDLMLPDNSYQYFIQDKKLVKKKFDFLIPAKKDLKEKIKPLCSEQISKIEWKRGKYHDNQYDVSRGKMQPEDAMTKEEFDNVIDTIQLYRDLSNVMELAVDEITSMKEVEETKKIFEHDLSDLKVCKKLLEKLRD